MVYTYSRTGSVSVKNVQSGRRRTVNEIKIEVFEDGSREGTWVTLSRLTAVGDS